MGKNREYVHTTNADYNNSHHALSFVVDLGAGHPLEGGEELQVLHGRELGEENVVLRAHAQALADALHVPGDALLAAHEGVAAAGRD